MQKLKSQYIFGKLVIEEIETLFSKTNTRKIFNESVVYQKSILVFFFSSEKSVSPKERKAKFLFIHFIYTSELR